jgi:transcriptional regulator of arginine metabolism
MNRSRRLAVLSRLLGARSFHSQEELARALSAEGLGVTQATLSRDLRSLGVGKRPDTEGRGSYVLPVPAGETLDRERQWLDLRAFVNEIRVAQNLVVVRTPPGHANGVGRALDMAEFEDVVGTVAGDDTVLIVMPDQKSAGRLKRRLESIAERGVAQ